MKTIASAFAFLLFLHASARADGNRVGNGGKGIECAKAGKTEVRLLDLYEAPDPIEKSLEGKTRDEILARALENLRRLAPRVGEQYARRHAVLESEIEFKADAKLTPTPDSFELSLPKDSGCGLRQIAIRRPQADALTKPFLFSKDLWDRMDARNQAALYLHEIVYEHFAKLGEKDSVKARKITAYLLSEKAFKDKPDDFWKIIQSMKLPIYR